MFKRVGKLICALLLLQGCTGAAVKQQAASVTSMPSGATVYANGAKLGITPLHHNLYKAFPASWNDWVLQATGALIVKMEGCEDYILNVDDNILSKPIHAKLTCSQAAQIKKETPVRKESSGVETKPIVAPVKGGIEGRLLKLESLYKKGVISKEEYETSRSRILNEL